MSVWDNQQEMSWLAGILEGEGSYYLQSNGGHRVTITNTNIEIIDFCVKILHKNLISYTLHWLHQTNKKPCCNLVIASKSNIRRLLRLLKLECRCKEFHDKLSSSTTTRDPSLTSDLYWLIGIFEAEGCFGLAQGDVYNYHPYISIKNTSTRIIQKVALTLQSLGVSWTNGEEKAANENSRKLFRIRIRPVKECRRFLMKTRTLWVSTYYNKCAELVLEYCNTQSSQRGYEIFTELQR